jgi:hypothetical protein
MQLNKVLSLSPGSRLIGYAYFEGNRLIDWGTKNNTVGPIKKRIFEKGLNIVADLVAYFGPETVILPAQEEDKRRVHRWRFIKAARTILSGNYVIVAFCSTGEAKRYFAKRLMKRPTIRNVAMVIGETFPQIKPMIPGPRQAYDCQDYWTLMFDAIARWLAWHQRKNDKQQKKSED